MTSSIHELSDNIESHEKQEHRESQISPISNSESIATNLAYTEQLPHSMAPGHYPYPDPYYRSIFAPPCHTQAYLPLVGYCVLLSTLLFVSRSLLQIFAPPCDTTLSPFGGLIQIISGTSAVNGECINKLCLYHLMQSRKLTDSSVEVISAKCPNLSVLDPG
ncbi:unnamed protein product [Arabis nemorensis]|uniref:Uncharacterized protein n=1 Tax=Arabis nemorensis TaxID=586526 RepID=A0A565AWV9_9BRAS|nr:unnamed protein product [Arabis nemorensis]